MKKKTNIIKTLFLSMVCSITIGLQSCGDYLDVEEYIDQMTFLDSVFSRKELLDQYINGAAQYIPNEGKLWSNSSTPFQIASDENFMSWNDSQHYGMKFLLDEITPYDGYYNNYPKYYQGIRMALTALWYNGNKFYADWQRTSDGANFISQENDNSKWGVSAAYSKYIIDSNKFELYWTPKEIDSKDLPTNEEFIKEIDPDYYEPYPKGAAGIDHYRSLTYTFSGEIPVMINPEFIYSCQMPTGDAPLVAAAPFKLGGWGGLNLVQDLIDAYQMVDGQDINESSQDYPYPDASVNFERIGGANQTFSGFTLLASTARMYNNREPRFYATIGFCHSFWPGTSSSENQYKNIEVTYYSDGYASANPDHPEDYNRTGYTCVKYRHLEDEMKKGTVKAKYFPVFRYAETLLNYVEAINELKEPYTLEMPNGSQVTVEHNTADIVKYFNLIRHRAGLPGITEAVAADRNKVRELIKHERRVCLRRTSLSRLAPLGRCYGGIQSSYLRLQRQSKKQ